MKDFIMVTPARNEEQFLPEVINSVAECSLAPKLWVFVDDNSTDRTSDILSCSSELYGYIRVKSLNEKNKRDLTFHYSYVCRVGFDYAVQLAKELNLEWDYMVLLDADTVVSKDYFDGILSKMEDNPKIGLASGDLHLLQNGQIKKIEKYAISSHLPTGTARVWSKKCFEDTGGYCITHAPDSVSRVKANLNGWDSIRFKEYEAYQLRETGSADGLIKGHFVKGKAAHYLNKHPLLVFLNVLYFSKKRPHYTGIAFLFGYISSILKNESQIEDEQIKDYHWNKRLKELFSRFINERH